MTQDLRQPEHILYQLLREWLSQRDPDLWADFERDPEGTAHRLQDFLVQAGAALPPTLAAYVSGGRVEKLINIAQAGVVYIQAPEAEPTLTPEERRELERDYLERVAEECRYLETEGVDRARAELTDVFVMLEAVESPRREAPADVAPVPERAEEMGLKERTAALFGRREAEREGRAPPPPPVPLSQALGAHTHLVILGEPGTGKTTTLRFVALCFATDGWAKDRLDLDEARVPVRVELREYDGAERLDDFLIRQLYRAYVPEAMTQAWLGEGRLAILLDGLDEVPEARRAAVAEAIERFAATKGQRCRVVLTSRIAGYREGRSLGDDFGQYTIRPFAGLQDAQPYAAGWLRALKPEAAENEAETLLEAMEQQGGLRRVMGNPLLLRLAVAVYVETGELARSRAELYRRYVEEVAWKRVEAREQEQPRWSRGEIGATLEALAWALQTQGEQTAAALGGVVEEAASVADGRELLDDLRERLGLLAVYGYERGDLVAFRHLTFQEYFAAWRLKRAWDNDPERAWRFLRPRLHHPAWREPILLLAGMLGETRATDLVRRILQAHSPYERELHRDLLLAVALLGDGAPVAADVAGRVTDRLTQLYLDVKVKWRYRLILPTSIWLLLAAGLYRYGTAPHYLIPLGTYIGWVIWVLWLCLRFFPRLQVVFALPHRLSGKCAYASLQEQVVNGLARLPMSQRVRAVEPLIRALGDWDADVRAAAARALGEIGDPRAVELLIRALGDGHRSVRGAAAWALGDIGDPRAVEPLIRALGDKGWYVRQAAAEALGEIGDPRAVEPLIRALRDEDVRGAAAWALGEIGDPRAVEPLIRALGDKGWSVRAAAARALGEMGDPQAVEPLIRALGDGYRSVRGAAAWALGDIGDPRAVQPLSRALGDGDWRVREAAARALGEIGDPRAVQPLSRALGDKGWYVRQAAAEALGAIGDPAVATLIRALRNWHADVRQATARALEAIGDPRAMQPLSRALGDRNDDVRCAAARALGKIDEKIEDRQTARRVARRLWWRLTDVEKVPNAAWEALARVVARFTELEVAALGAGPPLFAITPEGARPSPVLPVILSTLIAALSGLASNIVAAYLQEHYRLISDAGRFGLVVAVFLLALIVSIWLALRWDKGTAEAAERQ